MKHFLTFILTLVSACVSAQTLPSIPFLPPDMQARPVALVATAAPKIPGKPIGTAGSWGNKGNSIDRAFDGKLDTYFDAPAPGNSDWIGVDAGQPNALQSIQYAPRPGFAGRLAAAKVQGASTADFATPATLYTITTVPPVGTLTTAAINSKVGYRYFRLLFADGTYGNIAELAFFGSPVAVNSSEVAVIPNDRPRFYCDANTGDDSRDGKSPATAWKTPRVLSNSAVILASGETFDITAAPLQFNGKVKPWVGGDPALPPPTLFRSTGGMMLTYWTDTTEATLANVILDSKEASATAANVRGKNISILNVQLANLFEGFDYVDVDGLTIVDGEQIGAVTGRCHYFLKVSRLAWAGGKFGPASKQSPVRFSSPGVNGGTISSVVVTQKGSPFPIACWAVHAASGVTFNDCQSIGGDFSFDSAGEGVGNLVIGCTINRLTVTGGQLQLTDISRGNTFNAVVGTNPTGPCVNISGGTGSINGADFTTGPGKPAVMYRDPSAVTVSGVNSHGAKAVDGNFTAGDVK